MWISKEADVRRQEFIDAAMALFIEKGYDKTSINDILNRVGVTKGSFYYYFKSKEDLMAEIAEGEAKKHVFLAKKYADGDMSALDKLNGMIHAAKQYNRQNRLQRFEIYKLYESEENAQFSKRIQRQVLDESVPYLERIIHQGIKEGSFTTMYPKEAAKTYIYLMNLLKSEVLQYSLNDTEDGIITDIGRKLSFYQDLLEKMLGARCGSLQLTAEPTDLI